MKTECTHERCQSNGHCILSALWFNPPEFTNEEPIKAAVLVQDAYWKRQREWEVYENETVATLWRLVEAGGQPT